VATAAREVAGGPCMQIIGAVVVGKLQVSGGRPLQVAASRLLAHLHSRHRHISPKQ
jgi:hypothetical protein